MSDSIRISASIRIERPAEVVRQQYRDIDHHIRNNVHADIHYAWEPAPPGHRKIRTTFTLLGAPQYDVSELVDAADGTFVIRYLEGTNAGMVLLHRFVPLGPEATQVELVADVPPTLARKLLGPLYIAGARQVMRKALAEDKRDLEQGAYVGWKAAGNLQHALAFLKPPSGGLAFVRPFAERDLAAKRALLEAACLVAVADGRVQSGELDTLAELANLIEAPGEAPWIRSRAEALAAVASSPEILAQAARIGGELVTHGIGLEGITAAAVVALVSEGMSLGELQLLRELARVAGVQDGALPAVVETAERALATS